ncbi:unnamed protein product [Candida verbasci]|uniref:RanBD1 domain-containing protein n=1 Tax=Candida verbasci TaxID=1227364 RepID=A0A9W4TWG7_9ASCO|nr:unnamed protein product [Candida verbasci]
MVEESPIKRKIDTEEEDKNNELDNSIQLKRSKSTTKEEVETNKNDNAALKQSIIDEVTRSFNDKINNLESRIKKLENILYLDDDEGKEETISKAKVIVKNENNTVPPPLPPREPTITTNRPQITNNFKPKSTFGAPSFSFPKNTAATGSVSTSSPAKTPLSSFNESTTVPNSPKPVFGATTSFGNKENTPLKPTKTETNNNTSKITSSFGFGSNSRFGNAFQESLKKKSFLDDEAEAKKEDKETMIDKESTPRPQEYKQVDLTPIEQTTGEEDEKSLFNCTAKLFELNFKNMSEGWKERGVGPLHLNQKKSDNSLNRLVMRSNGLLKVILNYKLTKETEVLKGLESSLTPGKYFRLNSINESKEPIQYLLKFSNEDIRNELIEKIESATKA